MSTATDAAEAPALEGVPGTGDIVAGKYRVEHVLGQGGMGVVVAAEHTTLRTRVAVKFLLPEAMERAGSVDRFLREARAASAIKSEHVARVLDVGTLESGGPYMVMEYLVGQDLGDFTRDRGPLPIAEAVDYILQASEAIAEAHSINIIHRDLKPANLFITKRTDGSPLVKVLDFGLSKVVKSDMLEASLTAANVVMGSPFYMSPEQIRGLKGIDARADVWSLGVILYQLISGVRPFDGESLGSLFLAIGADAPPPIREKVPAIPGGLDQVIMRCLEKDVGARVQSVGELARALEPFGSPESRVSVERILRVLSDTPLPPRSSFTNEPTGGHSLAATVHDDSGPVPSKSGASVKATTGEGMSNTLGDLNDATGPRTKTPGAEAKGRERRSVLVGLALAVFLGVVAIAVVMRMRPKGSAETALASTGAAASAPPPSVALSVEPPPSASVPVAVEAPTASAAAASASATIPAASASAPPAVSAKVPVKAGPGKGKGNKSKDPLERWR